MSEHVTFSDASVATISPTYMTSFDRQDFPAEAQMPVATGQWVSVPVPTEPMTMYELPIQERPVVRLPVIAYIVPHEAQAYKEAGWIVQYDACHCGCVPVLAESHDGSFAIQNTQHLGAHSNQVGTNNPIVETPTASGAQFTLDPTVPAWTPLTPKSHVVGPTNSSLQFTLNPSVPAWTPQSSTSTAVMDPTNTRVSFVLNPYSQLWEPEDLAQNVADVQIVLHEPEENHDMEHIMPYQDPSYLSPFFHVPPADNTFGKSNHTEENHIGMVVDPQDTEPANIARLESDNLKDEAGLTEGSNKEPVITVPDIIISEAPVEATFRAQGPEIEGSDNVAFDNGGHKLSPEQHRTDDVEFLDIEFQKLLEKDLNLVVMVQDGQTTLVPSASEDSSSDGHGTANELANDLDKDFAPDQDTSEDEVDFAHYGFQSMLDDDDDLVVVVRDGKIVLVPAAEADDEEDSDSDNHASASHDDSFVSHSNDKVDQIVETAEKNLTVDHHQDTIDAGAEADDCKEIQHYWRDLNVEILPVIAEEDEDIEDVQGSEETPGSSVSTSVTARSEQTSASQADSDDETLSSKCSHETTLTADSSPAETTNEISMATSVPVNLPSTKDSIISESHGVDFGLVADLEAEDIHTEASQTQRLSNTQEQPELQDPYRFCKPFGGLTPNDDYEWTPRINTGIQFEHEEGEVRHSRFHSARDCSTRLCRQFSVSAALHTADSVITCSPVSSSGAQASGPAARLGRQNCLSGVKAAPAPSMGTNLTTASTARSQAGWEIFAKNNGVLARTTRENPDPRKPEAFGNLDSWVVPSFEDIERQWRASRQKFQNGGKGPQTSSSSAHRFARKFPARVTALRAHSLEATPLTSST